MIRSKKEGGGGEEGAKSRKGQERAAVGGVGAQGGLEKGIPIFKCSETALKVNNPSSKEAPTYSCLQPPTLERVMLSSIV